MQLLDMRPDHIELVQRILRQHVPRAEVWAFGSRAKWLARDTSDLDLCIRAPVALSFEQMGALREAFEESNLPYKVDVVDWTTTSESFRKIIERDKVVVRRARRSWVMAGEETVQLRDVCVKIGSGATPRGGKEAYKGGATSLIRSQNIYNEGFRRDGLVYIDDKQSAELRNVEVKLNDVLLNITGDSVARCCQVAADVLPARVNQHVAIIRPQPESLDARFLRYVLVSQEYQSRLLALASAGATRPALTKSMIEELSIPSPPLPEQKAIAHILGTLDDKIELNRRMNATLEKMARALFQSWFVDFDPVRAKLDGRKPIGLDTATAALFPATFQDSAVGHIPQGWKMGVLDDLTSSVIGGDWGEYEATDDEIVSCYCIRGADIPSLQSGGVGKMPTRFLKPSSVEKRQLAGGDLAIEISGGSPTQCTGRPVLASDALLRNLGQPLVASNFCRIVKLKSPALSKFVYLWLRRLYDNGELFQFETGTTGIKNFAFVIFSGKYPLVVPGIRVAEAFDRTVSPLFVRIQANAHQSRTLATLRDTLLPKLLSGELSVAALNFVADAGNCSELPNSSNRRS